MKFRHWIGGELRRDWYVIAVAAVLLAVWLVFEVRYGPAFTSYRLINDSAAVRRVAECDSASCAHVYDRGARVKAHGDVDVDLLIGHGNANWYAVFDQGGARVGCLTLNATHRAPRRKLAISGASPCASSATLACTAPPPANRRLHC